MVRGLFLTLTFFLSLILAGCGGEDAQSTDADTDDGLPDTLVTEGYDQAEMDAAIARARRETEQFIAELTNPVGEGHAVKAPITDGEDTEHFWLSEIRLENGSFTGTISNEPGLVNNVQIGQSWTIKKEEISDWMYMRDGKMYGNYTMRPLLPTMPKEEADFFRRILVEP